MISTSIVSYIALFKTNMYIHTQTRSHLYLIERNETLLRYINILGLCSCSTYGLKNHSCCVYFACVRYIRRRARRWRGGSSVAWCHNAKSYLTTTRVCLCVYTSWWRGSIGFNERGKKKCQQTIIGDRLPCYTCVRFISAHLVVVAADG